MNTASRTDVGRIRTVNEDSAAVHTGADGLTIAVLADGMGGHQAGDIASRTTIEIMMEQLGPLRAEMKPDEWEQAIAASIERANAEIYRQSLQNPQYAGMGTTVVAAVAASRRLTVAHIGDSRAYMLHNDCLTQLTDDHSLVNELLKSGEISAEEASVHPRRNVLTRALGTDQQARADIRHAAWQTGDILLLCTDGLSNLLDESEIIHTLQSRLSLQEKADQLVEKALKAGGEDNVTVVLIENDGSEHREGRPA